MDTREARGRVSLLERRVKTLEKALALSGAKLMTARDAAASAGDLLIETSQRLALLEQDAQRDAGKAQKGTERVWRRRKPRPGTRRRRFSPRKRHPTQRVRNNNGVVSLWTTQWLMPLQLVTRRIPSERNWIIQQRVLTNQRRGAWTSPRSSTSGSKEVST